MTLRGPACLYAQQESDCRRAHTVVASEQQGLRERAAERPLAVTEDPGMRAILRSAPAALVAACVALATLEGMDAEPGTPVQAAPAVPLAKVLQSEQRWDVVKSLQAWDRDLTEEEKALLTAFARANERRDWLLQYCAHRVLRQHGDEGRVVAPEIEKAEAILLEVNEGKIPTGYYGPRADDIVELGNDAVPLLLDLLAYVGRFGSLQEAGGHPGTCSPER